MATGSGFCAKCGAALAEAGQEFCGKCGAPVPVHRAPPPPPAAAMPPGAPMMPRPGAPPWAGYPGAPYGVPGNKGSLLPIFLVLGLVGVLIAGGVIFALVALKPSSSSTPAGSGGSSSGGSTATVSGGGPTQGTLATPTLPAGGSIVFDPSTFSCSSSDVVFIDWWLPASLAADDLIMFEWDGSFNEFDKTARAVADAGLHRQPDGRWHGSEAMDGDVVCTLKGLTPGRHTHRVYSAIRNVGGDVPDQLLAETSFTTTP